MDSIKDSMTRSFAAANRIAGNTSTDNEQAAPEVRPHVSAQVSGGARRTRIVDDETEGAIGPIRALDDPRLQRLPVEMRNDPFVLARLLVLTGMEVDRVERIAADIARIGFPAYLDAWWEGAMPTGRRCPTPRLGAFRIKFANDAAAAALHPHGNRFVGSCPICRNGEDS